jgi:hypothetical protein
MAAEALRSGAYDLALHLPWVAPGNIQFVHSGIFNLLFIGVKLVLGKHRASVIKANDADRVITAVLLVIFYVSLDVMGSLLVQNDSLCH